jgi:hypothetical protein
MRQWQDDLTGLTVRQLTDLPGGASVSYFRCPKHVPGGWLVAFGRHERGNLLLLAPESGEVKPLALQVDHWLTLRQSDGRLWYVDPQRQVWAVDLPDGKPEVVGQVPASVAGAIEHITCDGRVVLVNDTQWDPSHVSIPVGRDHEALWAWLGRKRSSRLWAYDLPTGQTTLLAERPTLGFQHVDASPVEATLVRFVQDMIEFSGQRMWTVRTDGSDQRPLRVQELGEMITHEWWWPGGQRVGYTYMDRRGDLTRRTLPWGEYAPMTTEVGVCDLQGKEVYRSGPLNHWHSHLFCSADGRWICGEGTDGHSAVYAGRLDWGQPLRLLPLAAIHTPYLPTRGQNVNAGFSRDGRWLVYNDTHDGQLQVCAVATDPVG